MTRSRSFKNNLEKGNKKKVKALLYSRKDDFGTRRSDNMSHAAFLVRGSYHALEMDHTITFFFLLKILPRKPCTDPAHDI